MSTIRTVGVAKFTAPVTGEKIGTVDVCRDDDGYIHVRINDDHGNEVVLKLHHNQARRVYALLFDATWEGKQRRCSDLVNAE